MKATDELKKEHQGIELMLQVLRTVADRVEHHEGINAEHLNGMTEFLSVFVDKCHHGKEEEYLFPKLEGLGVPRDGGLIGVLLEEHSQGRKLVSSLEDAITRYNSGDKAVAASVKTIIDKYVELLTQHIAKENNDLFVMADAKMDLSEDMKMFKAFEELERERIGKGKHEEYHELLDRLRDAYLK